MTQNVACQSVRCFNTGSPMIYLLIQTIEVSAGEELHNKMLAFDALSICAKIDSNICNHYSARHLKCFHKLKMFITASFRDLKTIYLWTSLMKTSYKFASDKPTTFIQGEV